MRKLIYFFLLTLVLVSCSTDDKHFKIDGRLLHLNQGEFYVYSPDGDNGKLDTIKVEAGRFTYEIPCRRPMTLMIIFPNFTEQPVFAEPGKAVEIKGSASNLKEMEVKGTDDNKLMNAFREQVASASPPEARKYAHQFVLDHPESMVGSYLVRRYFIQSQNPDLVMADSLINLMIKHQPKYGYLRQLQQQIKGRGNSKTGTAVPAFSAQTIDGKSLTAASLSATPTAVVCVWASWNYESINMLRQLMLLKKNEGADFTLMGLSVDASIDDCRRAVKNNMLELDVVCDGEMVNGRLFKSLAFSYVPDNIVVKNGRVVARNLTMEQLKEQLKTGKTQ